ncbi:OmpA family protein [Vibrio brasiliensis]
MLKINDVFAIILVLIFSPSAKSKDDLSRLYLGIQDGHFNNIDKLENNVNSKDGILLGLYGGLYLSENWLFELGYQKYFHDNVEENKFESSLLMTKASLKYRKDIKDKFNIFGNVGVVYLGVGNKDNNSSNSEVSPLFEIGVGYDLTKRIMVDTSFQYTPDVGDIGSSKAILLSMSYRFGFSSDTRKSLTTARDINDVNDSLSIVLETNNDESNKLLSDNNIASYSNEEPKKYITLYRTDSGDYLFESNSTYIGDAYKGVLSDISNLLIDNQDSMVFVVGHADSIGSVTQNQKLSEKRAELVAQQLIKRGVDKSRIKTKGAGEKEPISDNHTPEGRAKNRRVEVIVVPNSSEPTTSL